MSESTKPENESEPTEVSDPDAYVNHRRLKSIFDIRDEMRESRRKVKMADHRPVEQVTTYEALSAYRALVDSYVVETEPLLRKYDRGVELLEEEDFGKVLVKPTVITGGEYRKVRVGGEEISTRNVPKGRVYELEGLLSVIEQPDPLTAELKLNKPHNHARNPVHKVLKKQIKFKSLDRMVRGINNFLAEIGFELNPREEQDPLEL